MADLPADRVSTEPPFMNVGLDVSGAWTVSAWCTRDGHAQTNRWAVIFTYMSVRAVHMELIESLDTSSFINSLGAFSCYLRACEAYLFRERKKKLSVLVRSLTFPPTLTVSLLKSSSWIRTVSGSLTCLTPLIWVVHGRAWLNKLEDYWMQCFNSLGLQSWHMRHSPH